MSVVPSKCLPLSVMPYQNCLLLCSKLLVLLGLVVQLQSLCLRSQLFQVVRLVLLAKEVCLFLCQLLVCLVFAADLACRVLPLLVYVSELLVVLVFEQLGVSTVLLSCQKCCSVVVLVVRCSVDCMLVM